MIHDFEDTLKDRYDRETLEVLLPDVFENMLSYNAEAKWEFWKSNKIQKCKLFYKHCKVTDSEGIVFVHTHLKN